MGDTLDHTGLRIWGYTLDHPGLRIVLWGHTGSPWVEDSSMGTHTGSHWVENMGTHTGSPWVEDSSMGTHWITLG